jgi:hypothetical protein
MCARYLQDANKIVLLHESGTYANASGNGVWIGEVTENSIDDNENKLEDRFLGTASRSFGNLQQGPRDVTGTLTYNAQNFRIPFFAIGSTVDGSSGTNVLHDSTQIDTDARQSAFTSGTLNPPISFTLEDSKQSTGTGRNFIRTVNGAVPNTTTITATQGEKITVDLDYVGQTLVSSSGTTTSVTQDNIKPYLWSSASLTVAGSNLDTTKEVSLEINQNIEAPHYLNGSRDISTPFPQNRDYTLSITLDLDGNDADFMYNDLYKSNTTFNAVLDFNQDVTSTGSQHAIFTMSGCKIMTFENPSTNEGATESTIEIKPQNVSAQEWTSTDSTVLFNPY